jgi:transcriptional regulator GlxA family with amidase domain
MAEMTKTQEIPPSLPEREGPRVILFVTFEGMGMLDLSGSMTVFWSASKFMAEHRKPGYELHTVSVDGGLVTTAEGVGIATLPLAHFASADIDTIVVPGALDMVPVLQERRLVDWLAVAASGVRRTASVCGGAFLLAEAGLLNDRRAVTHWAMCDMLAANYPSVKVEADAIFVRDEPVWTSAGVSAGIDLSLALIQDDCGRDVAMQVARQLVVYMKRPGGQSQFSELLKAQATSSTVFDKLHRWMQENLGNERLTVEALADRAGMSPRNFARSYKAKTGRTPAKALELFRLEAARRLLEESEQGVDRIAQRCGFGDEERMRVTFKRNLAVSPRDYRRHFASPSTVLAEADRRDVH